MDTEVNNSSNRLATTGFISKEQNAIERKYAPTLNRIGADINSKTAIVTQSRDLVNQAVSDAVADQQMRVNQAKMFLEMNLDAIDRMEGIYKDAYKDYVRREEKELDRQYKEKTAVADLMMDNPRAGITTNDSYTQAANKIARSGGSLDFRKEERLSRESTAGASNLDNLAQDYLDGVIEDSDIPLAQRASVKKRANELATQALGGGEIAAPSPVTKTSGGLRGTLNKLFSISPLSGVAPITFKPAQNLFSRIFGK